MNEGVWDSLQTCGLLSHWAAFPRVPEVHCGWTSDPLGGFFKKSNGWTFLWNEQTQGLYTFLCMQYMFFRSYYKPHVCEFFRKVQPLDFLKGPPSGPEVQPLNFRYPRKSGSFDLRRPHVWTESHSPSFMYFWCGGKWFLQKCGVQTGFVAHVAESAVLPLHNFIPSLLDRYCLKSSLRIFQFLWVGFRVAG
jgi:hypothetical protein